jgi:penicillin-binding protein 2B
VRKPKLKENEQGSVPVSMIFNSVVKNSLQYLNIKPTSNGEEKKTESTNKKQVGFELPSYEGRNISEVTEQLTQKGANVIVIGDGNKVLAQAPYASAHILPGERVLLKTDGAYSMPDLTSWSLRDVMKLSDLFELKLNIMGNGYVKNQNIPPGSSVKDGDQIVIEMDIPNSSREDTNAEETVDEIENEDETEKPLD